MKPELRPIQRDVPHPAPHPLVTLTGVLIAFSLIAIALKTTLLPRSTMIIVAISFAVVFRWVSRWSARTMRERRERELEQLRTTPIFHLND
jgi:Flp pilus assembly protein TadB